MTTFESLNDLDAVVRAVRRYGFARVPGYFAEPQQLEAVEHEMKEVFRSDAPWVNHYSKSGWPGHLAQVKTSEAAAENRMPVARGIMDPTKMRTVIERCAGACADNSVPIIKYSHEWIPGVRNLGLHYDWVRSVKWMCFLSRVNENNGAIRTWVGSHRPVIALVQEFIRQGIHVQDLPWLAELVREELPSQLHPNGITELVFSGKEKLRIHVRIEEYFPTYLLNGERGDLYLFEGAILHEGGMLANKNCHRMLVRGHGRTLQHWGELAPEPHRAIHVLESTRPIASGPGIFSSTA